MKPNTELPQPAVVTPEESKQAQPVKPKEIKKEAKIVLPKPKTYFDVKVECMLPATLTYLILAEDAEQAADLIKGQSPNSVQHKLVGRKEIALKVYDSGSCMIRFVKKLMGR